MARKYGSATTPSSGLIRAALNGKASRMIRLTELQQMDAM